MLWCQYQREVSLQSPSSSGQRSLIPPGHFPNECGGWKVPGWNEILDYWKKRLQKPSSFCSVVPPLHNVIIECAWVGSPKNTSRASCSESKTSNICLRVEKLPSQCSYNHYHHINTTTTTTHSYHIYSSTTTQPPPHSASCTRANGVFAPVAGR